MIEIRTRWVCGGLSYSRGGTVLTPNPVLTDRNATSTEISLRWWNRGRDLLDAMRAAADRTGATIDLEAERRLGPRRVV